VGKFDGVLLVSDFDETLYARSRRVPERNVQAIRYFQSEGGRFTVATGRAHRTFAAYFHLAPINAPVVLSNGSTLYDFETDTLLEQTVLPVTAPADLGWLLEQFPRLAMEAYHGEEIYAWNPNDITDAHMSKVGTGYDICPPRDIPVPWTKAILQHDDYQLLQRAQKRFLERFGGEYEAIFSNRTYLEITAKGSTKGGMVWRIVEMLGLRAENVYCVGDNQNDITMLERSAVPFAPGDCAEEVKDWGARLLCSCEDGVIADVIAQLDKRYEKTLHP